MIIVQFLRWKLKCLNIKWKYERQLCNTPGYWEPIIYHLCLSFYLQLRRKAFNKSTLSLEGIRISADPEVSVCLECCLSCSMSLDIVDLLVFVSALTTPKTQEAYFGGDIVMNILIVHSPRKKTWIPWVSPWVIPLAQLALYKKKGWWLLQWT